MEGATRFSSGKDPAGIYENVDGHDLFREEGDRGQGFLSNTTARRDLARIVNNQENLITVEAPTTLVYNPYGNFYYLKESTQ